MFVITTVFSFLRIVLLTSSNQCSNFIEKRLLEIFTSSLSAHNLTDVAYTKLSVSNWQQSFPPIQFYSVTNPDHLVSFSVRNQSKLMFQLSQSFNEMFTWTVNDIFELCQFILMLYGQR